ncbi:splicing factor 3b [Fusarium beomiforme]|uniref:Splicing factor 3b n=1 Tax=Fusarium beomiforme TaxID=44412 RepID=A0A9P5AAZ5_9HYPO|nr:splicing factor 3b [Fusarium beomiforme]
MTTYTIITQQGRTELATLSGQNYQLQVAKSVSSPSGQPSFNMVYQSQFLGPNMEVQWTTTYGLNWTTNIPSAGSTVVYSGDWQQCNLGDSYDLNSVGEWVPNQNNPNSKSNSLNIGKNNYQEAVNVIVGVQDASTGHWKPIWVSPDQLLKQSNGEYEPLQAIQLWYAEGTQTSTMISAQATAVQGYTATSSNPEYFSFDVAAGNWRESQATPFQGLP